jgi:hypothetical protein
MSFNIELYETDLQIASRMVRNRFLHLAFWFTMVKANEAYKDSITAFPFLYITNKANAD